MWVNSVKMAPESELVLISDLQRESCDVESDCRISESSDAYVGDICDCTALHADKRSHKVFEEWIIDVCEDRDKIRCIPVRFWSIWKFRINHFSCWRCNWLTEELRWKTGTSTDIKSVTETETMGTADTPDAWLSPWKLHLSTIFSLISDINHIDWFLSIKHGAWKSNGEHYN